MRQLCSRGDDGVKVFLIRDPVTPVVARDYDIIVSQPVGTFVVGSSA